MKRKWTKRETEYVEKFYEKRGVPYIADKLNRTQYSVKRKAQKLGHNAYVCEDLYARTLARCFDCNSRVINRWIDKYGLPCKIIQRGQTKCRLISVDNFWKWAGDHKELILWHKYERLSIVPEPDWIEEAIQTYTVRNHRKRITPMEKQYAIAQRKRGRSFEEIAKEMNRTVNSIKHIWRKRKRSDN